MSNTIIWQDLKSTERMLRKTLNSLELVKAKFGFNVPPDVTLSIEDITAFLNRLNRYELTQDEWLQSEDLQVEARQLYMNASGRI